MALVFIIYIYKGDGIKISNERKAQIFYQGNGSQTQYSFPFDYLRKAFVHVSLISDEKIEELTQGTDFTVTDRVVTLAAPTGLKIKIYRQTATKPLVGWADASVLRAADMTVQSTQLLHLAEETSDLAQDGGLSKDSTDNIWDARYNKIKNLLDPTEPGDAVTLSYITKNQDSLLTQLNNTGAAQNTSIVSTGDAQNKRVTSTGDTQNTRLTSTGDTQDKRLNDLGKKYVDLMTTLKDTATTKATEAENSAELSKKWAVSDTSPDGVTGNKSSKTWAEEAKTAASNSASSASSSQSSANASSASATQAANSASASKSSATASASSASAASSSASAASTSATNAKTSETNAANSAKAAKQSEENAKTWDPTQYVQSVTESNGKVTVTKGGGESTTFNAGLNILARNKSYAVGDIAYSPNLPSCLYLECTTSGTTGATEPNMSAVASGVTVNDGTAKFVAKTVCAKEYVDLMLDHIECGITPVLKANGLSSASSTVTTKYAHDTSKPVIISRIFKGDAGIVGWADLVPAFDGWIDSTHFRIIVWNNNGVNEALAFTWMCI